MSAAGDALTREPTIGFQRLQGLRLVLPRRPSHWRHALEEAARGFGFRLEAVVEADSLTVQKELVAATPGLYSILGPFSIAADVRSGRLQASRIVGTDLTRHVTLAFPRQGKLAPAWLLLLAVGSLGLLWLTWGRGWHPSGHIGWVWLALAALLALSLGMGALAASASASLRMALSATGLITAPAFAFSGVGFPLASMPAGARASTLPVSTSKIDGARAYRKTVTSGTPASRFTSSTTSSRYPILSTSLSASASSAV